MIEKLNDLFTRYAPTGAALVNFFPIDIDEYIIIYRDAANAFTPYFIRRLNSSGFYGKNRCYSYYDAAWSDYLTAWADFKKEK